MKYFKSLLKILKKTLVFILGTLLLYGFFAILLTYITVNNSTPINANQNIYLISNGVHASIVLSVNDISTELRTDLQLNPQTKYLAFGWGDENFYLHTPTWADLTAKNAINALLWKSDALMHVYEYRSIQSNWKTLPINEASLLSINHNINSYFKTNQQHSKIILTGKGYGYRDNFYKANGNYSCFKTCNTWVNQMLKSSDIKACVWTPFDFGVMRLGQ